MTYAEDIFAVLLGLVLIVIGILNRRGNVSMLHSYHRKRVTEDNMIPFGKCVGNGMMIIGSSITLAGCLTCITKLTENHVYGIVGYVIMAIGTVVGIGFAFYAMKKYNKGIF